MEIHQIILKYRKPYNINYIIYKSFTSTCSGVQLSKLTDRTKLIWTPRCLWIPEHCKQINIPSLTDAHLGATLVNYFKTGWGLIYLDSSIIGYVMIYNKPFRLQSAQN